METLAQLLHGRIKEARKRVEDAREVLAAAQSDLKKWEDALTLELRTGMKEMKQQPSSISLASVLRDKPSWPGLEDLLTKTGAVRMAFSRTGKPLLPSEVVALLEPKISRSTVYNAISQMKVQGELMALPDGRLELVQKEDEKKTRV